MTFNELMRKISPRIRAIAKQLDGKYTFLDDDDLFQQAMLHLWREHKADRLSGKTESYIAQGCMFFLKNYIRTNHKTIDRNSVSLEKETPNGESLIETISDTGAGDGDADNIRIKALRNSLDNDLSERERKVLDCYLRGLTTREIGRRFNVSHPMVIKIEKRIFEKCRSLSKGRESKKYGKDSFLGYQRW
jgi:RNA polymerase sigma factor (sigma-70 family)